MYIHMCVDTYAKIETFHQYLINIQFAAGMKKKQDTREGRDRRIKKKYIPKYKR